MKYSILLLALFFSFSCSSDDDPVIPDPEPKPTVDPTIKITLGSSFAVNRYDVVKIEPEITITDGENISTTYQWSIKENGKDSIICDQKILQFISPKSGEYNVDFAVTCGKTTEKETIKVNVGTDEKIYSKRADKVIDYMIAPFIGYYGLNYSINSKEELIAYAQTEYANGSSLDLGTFGGYIILQFDHTVINTYGKRDLFVGCIDQRNSPAAILVAYDANRNGVADDDEWYEIAGSEYYKSTTVKNYEITYFRPDADKEFVPGKHNWQIDIESVKWTDNKGGSGYITQTDEWGYPGDNYPMWLDDSYTLKGTKLYLPTKDVSDGEGTKWNIGTFEWGYGGIKDSNIDISWAVDKEGNKVYLPGIDFVRLYNPVFTETGVDDLLISTFKDIEDLNLVSEDKR